MKNISKLLFLFLLHSIGTLATEVPKPTDQKSIALRKLYVNRVMDDIRAQYPYARISSFSGKPVTKDDKDDKKKDDPDLSKSANAAKNLFDSLSKANVKIPDFSSNEAIEFPLLVNLVTEGNNQVVLCFNDMKIFPGYAELSVFVKLRFGEKTLFFGANKLKYLENSQSSFFQSANIVLLGDATYKTKSYTIKLKGGEIDSKGELNSVTSLFINCGKLETLNLGGEVELNPKTFIPIDSKGIPSKDSSDRVKSTLNVTLDISKGFTKLANPIFELSFSPFTLKSYQDKIGFKVDKITLDLSDIETPAGVSKVLEEIQKDKEDPNKEKVDKEAKAKIDAIADKGEKEKAEKSKKEADKKEKEKLENDIKSWKGIYIAALEVYLPDELKGKEKNETKDSTTTAKADSDKKEVKDKKYKDLRVFGAKDLVINDVGLTFSAYGYNVVRLNDDRPISKWDMSVDTVTVKFLNSSLKKFSIAGKIRIPTSESKCDAAKTKDSTNVAKKDEPKTFGDNKDAASLMAYRGAMSLSAKVNNYSLAVDFPTKKKYGFLGGEAEFKANSGIELSLEKKTGESAQFQAKLTLNGEWSFAVKTGASTTKDIGTDKKPNACMGADTTNKTVGFRKVEFTKCEFMTKSPYFKLGNFLYADTTNNINNYPIFLEKFEAKTVAAKEEKKDDKKDDKKDGDEMFVLEVGIKFRVSLADKALTGKADMGIMFDYGTKNKEFAFAYKDFKINDIEVKGDFSAVKFEGRLKMMREDPDYGNGFMGKLDFAFGKESPKGLKMNIIWGKKDPVGRYCYGDIFLVKEQLFKAKAVQVNGIGLGFAYRMVPTDDASDFSSFGKKFIPKGGRASILVGAIYTNIAKEPVKPGSAFDGKVLMMVNFGGKLGIASIMAQGDIRVNAKKFEMPTEAKAGSLFKSLALKESKPDEKIADKKAEAEKDDKKEDPQSGSFVANVGLEINLERIDIMLSAAAYLDMGALHGGQAKNKIGDATLYIGSEGFYAWLGTPKNPLSVVIDIKDDTKARGEAYLDLGKLPPADEMSRTYPSGLYSILDKANTKLKEKGRQPYTLFNPAEAARLNAKSGILVGVSVSLDKARYETGPFWAEIGGGVGFDMMIAKYSNGKCANGGTIDGVYGQGQLYIYATVGAGVRIPEWKIFGPWNVGIGTFNGLVIGKAGIPKPFYIDGLLYGHYKYNVNLPGWGNVEVFNKEFVFNVKAGKECSPVAQPPQLTPAQRLSDLGKGVINTGHSFKKDEKIWSKNSDYYLSWASDGHLATYTSSNRRIWKSDAPGVLEAGFMSNAFYNSGYGGPMGMAIRSWSAPIKYVDPNYPASVLSQSDEDGTLSIFDTEGNVVWTNRNAWSGQKSEEQLKDDENTGVFSRGYVFETGKTYTYANPRNTTENTQLTFTKENSVVIEATTNGQKKTVYSWNVKDFVPRTNETKLDPTHEFRLTITNIESKLRPVIYDKTNENRGVYGGYYLNSDEFPSSVAKIRVTKNGFEVPNVINGGNSRWIRWGETPEDKIRATVKDYFKSYANSYFSTDSIRNYGMDVRYVVDELYHLINPTAILTTDNMLYNFRPEMYFTGANLQKFNEALKVRSENSKTARAKFFEAEKERLNKEAEEILKTRISEFTMYNYTSFFREIENASQNRTRIKYSELYSFLEKSEAENKKIHDELAPIKKQSQSGWGWGGFSGMPRENNLRSYPGTPEQFQIEFLKRKQQGKK